MNEIVGQAKFLAIGLVLYLARVDCCVAQMQLSGIFFDSQAVQQERRISDIYRSYSTELQRHGAHLLYFEVTGNSLKAIREQIRQKGPLDSGNIRREALTRWSLDWWQEGNAVYIRPSSHVVMPILSHSLLAPADFEAWRSYLDALFQHELGHISIFREQLEAAKRQLESHFPYKVILNVKPAKGAAPDPEVTEFFSSFVSALKEKQREYDQFTDHGRNLPGLANFR